MERSQAPAVARRAACRQGAERRRACPVFAGGKQGQCGQPHPSTLSKLKPNTYRQAFGWPEGSALRGPP
ncbi:hypothetical protein [Paenibacillus sp. GCM10012306]|uniref:hypothetical protein n=1 Tax=Paenibacillus sp. GCM10012306 TaxID=3317342 RepID=UPI003611AEBB